VAEVSK